MNMTEEFERKIYFEPAYDKRDPEPSKNYGIGAVKIRFVLKGEKGAVQFLIGTDWYLPEVRKELGNKLMSGEPMAWDLGHHALKPTYEGEAKFGPCEYLDGRDCYYDGSGLNAEPVLELLIRKGDEAVWKYLENYYKNTFGER